MSLPRARLSLDVESDAGGPHVRLACYEPPLSPSDSRRRRQRTLYAALALAQLLSFLIAATGVTSEALAVKRALAAPAFQAFLNYCLLALAFGGWLLATGAARLRQAWYKYALLAFVDVQANYLVTKAYQYTSLTSVTLLDCVAIPGAMVISRLLLRARYGRGHYAGAATCLAGVALLLATEKRSHAAAAGSGGGSAGPAPLLGDALAIAGGLLYAACNVGQEAALQGARMPELLAMLGVFGALIAGAQSFLLERSVLMAADWMAGDVALFVGFAVSMFAFYSLVPCVLLWSSATALNLSLLSADLYSAAARARVFGGFGGTLPAVFFALAFVTIAGGIVMYAMSDARLAAGSAADDEDVGGGGKGAAATAIVSEGHERPHSASVAIDADATERQLLLPHGRPPSRL